MKQSSFVYKLSIITQTNNPPEVLKGIQVSIRGRNVEASASVKRLKKWCSTLTLTSQTSPTACDAEITATYSLHSPYQVFVFDHLPKMSQSNDAVVCDIPTGNYFHFQ